MQEEPIDRSLPIFVAGAAGMVGSCLVRRLERCGYTNILQPRRAELDLTRQTEVEHWFQKNSPAYVVLAAAKVGGIGYNSRFPADFLYENLAIAINVIRSAVDSGTRKLLFLGSSCIYPGRAPQPMKEEYLLTGPLEITNEAYALSKIAGLKLCEYYFQQKQRRFVSAMPTNIYGPGDNFHPEYSHVIPSLIGRFHKAKTERDSSVTIWGSGTARREFLFVEDLVEALILLLDCYNRAETINVGVGTDVTIEELAATVARIVGFEGTVEFDRTKPDGAPQKLLDVSRIKHFGWQARIGLEEGLRKTYEWALRHNVFTPGYSRIRVDHFG